MGANNSFNPDDYSGNVQNAVTAARAAGGAVVLSAGKTYTITTPVVLDWNNAYLGCPNGRAKLVATGATMNAVELGNATTGVSVENIQITRDVVGGVNACGIRQNVGALSNARLVNLTVDRHGVGLSLSGTDFSMISDVIARHNSSHGFSMSSSGGAAGSSGPCQWYFAGQNLSEKNGGSGLVVQALPGYNWPAGFSVGTITNFATFDNGGYGIAAIGLPALPLFGFRIADCFIGADANDEIYLDTYGADHMIDTVYVELGRSRGVHITANNRDYTLNNVRVDACAGIGIASTGNNAMITNCAATRNGQTGPNKWGLYLEGSRTIVSGGRYGNPAPGVGHQQAYGIVSAGGSSQIIDNVNCYGNDAAPTSLSGAATVGHIFG